MLRKMELHPGPDNKSPTPEAFFSYSWCSDDELYGIEPIQEEHHLPQGLAGEHNLGLSPLQTRSELIGADRGDSRQRASSADFTAPKPASRCAIHSAATS